MDILFRSDEPRMVLTLMIPLTRQPGLSKQAAAIVGLGLLLAAVGCGERIDPDGSVGSNGEPDIPYPVIERDLDEIPDPIKKDMTILTMSKAAEAIDMALIWD